MVKLMYLENSTLGFGEEDLMLKDKQHIHREPQQTSCSLYSRNSPDVSQNSDSIPQVSLRLPCCSDGFVLDSIAILHYKL